MSDSPLSLSLVRRLHLRPGAGSGRSHLAAASGLVRLGDQVLIAADDEHHLGVFEIMGDAPGRLLRVLEGVLPEEPRARKKAKPDHEAIVALPGAGEGAARLLLVPSGSKPHRCVGVDLRLSPDLALLEAPRRVDLSGLFDALRAEHFEGVNIEGAVVLGEELVLLQRGNKKGAPNAVLRLGLDEVLRELGEAAPRLTLASLRSLREVELGCLDGVRLTFTDVAASRGELFFTAAAERTEDSYEDGPVVGSVVGLLAATDEVAWTRRIRDVLKLEGIAEGQDASSEREFLLVSDPDDPSTCGSLYRLRLPPG